MEQSCFFHSTAHFSLQGFEIHWCKKSPWAVCATFKKNISISHSLFLFLHVSAPLMLQPVVVVFLRLFLQGLCLRACVCACMCVSDPVFLSSLQSFSLHLVLIRTNIVEVSGLTAAFTMSLCACQLFFFSPLVPVSFHRSLITTCVFMHYMCPFHVRVYFDLYKILRTNQEGAETLCTDYSIGHKKKKDV